MATILTPIKSLNSAELLKSIKVHTTVSSMKRAGACAKEIKVIKESNSAPTITYILKDKWEAHAMSTDLINWDIANGLDLDLGESDLLSIELASKDAYGLTPADLTKDSELTINGLKASLNYVGREIAGIEGFDHYLMLFIPTIEGLTEDAMIEFGIHQIKTEKWSDILDSANDGCTFLLGIDKDSKEFKAIITDGDKQYKLNLALDLTLLDEVEVEVPDEIDPVDEIPDETEDAGVGEGEDSGD
jgi:hypothetical protein